MREIIIKSVLKDSIGEDLGISEGDILLSINNKKVTDIIDYKFEQANNLIKLEIQKKDGQIYVYDIEKDYDEDLGIEFQEEIIDKPRHCQNKCIFCFIDQLPKNVRKSLLFKDDDYRLSFLEGNFITMTNMSDEDIMRIIKYKLSPLYVSIHATDDEVRKKITNNKNAGGILEKIKILTQNGIQINAQVVLCPGINDKNILHKTIKDLVKFYPMVKSLAVVPVGLTDHRENLYELKPFNKYGAINVIEEVSSLQKKFKRIIGSSFVFLSDEFYILANKPVPGYKHYENFLQIENGVGLLALFEKQFNDNLILLKSKNFKKNKYIVLTGTSAYKFMNSLTHKLKKYEINIEVQKIQNNFFGHNITVSGLIVGRDIIEQMKGKINDEILIIPDVMLRKNSDVFLDDLTVKDVEKHLKAKVLVSEVNGADFIQKIKMGR